MPTPLHLSPCAQVVSETLEGEVVAIRLDTGSYYSMDGVAGEIWQGLERGASLDTIVSHLGACYAASPATIGLEVQDFAGLLQAEGLVAPAEASTAEASPAAAPHGFAPDTPRPFRKPSLRKFTDLKDLFRPTHATPTETGWPIMSY